MARTESTITELVRTLGKYTLLTKSLFQAVQSRETINQIHLVEQRANSIFMSLQESIKNQHELRTMQQQLESSLQHLYTLQRRGAVTIIQNLEQLGGMSSIIQSGVAESLVQQRQLLEGNNDLKEQQSQLFTEGLRFLENLREQTSGIETLLQRSETRSTQFLHTLDIILMNMKNLEVQQKDNIDYILAITEKAQEDIVRLIQSQGQAFSTTTRSLDQLMYHSEEVMRSILSQQHLISSMNEELLDQVKVLKVSIFGFDFNTAT